MSGVEEVRAGVTRAAEQARQASGAIAQADMALEAALQMLSGAMHGSSQSEAQQAIGALQQARQGLTESQQNIQVAVSVAEGYASRL